jgi:STE24 endopeptidase
MVNAVALTACGGLAVVASIALFVVATVRARAIERSPSQDRVHELRVLLRQLGRVSPLLGGAGGGLCVALTNWSAIGVGTAALTVVVILAGAVLPVAAGRRPVIAAYARLRGIPLKALRTSPRRLVILLAAIAVLGWPAAAALAAGPGLAVEVAVVLVGYLVVNPVALALLTPVFAWALGTRALPGEVGQRLSALADRVGWQVRGGKIAGRARKTANAAQAGWLPGLRYVLITDYLLDELTPAEVDAVIAHELGHGVHRDMRDRQFRACLQLVPVGWLGVAVARQSTPLIVAGLILLAGTVVIARRRGPRAIRQELAADDLAAAIVGPETLAAALERLTELNAIKRDTTLSWDRRVGHPAMAQRIARLRAGGPGAAPAPGRRGIARLRAGGGAPAPRPVTPAAPGSPAAPAETVSTGMEPAP